MGENEMSPAAEEALSGGIELLEVKVEGSLHCFVLWLRKVGKQYITVFGDDSQGVICSPED